MSLHQQIKTEIQKAMLAKEEIRLNTLRGLVSAFVNELVAKRRKPNEELTDEEVLDVIRKGVRQRKDSIEQFRKGSREDLVEREEAELKILETYLPLQMSQDEIRKVVMAKKEEMGVTDKSKIGMFMGAVMKELKNKADGGDVKTIIESLFE